MNRNMVLAGMVAGLMLLSAAAGALAMHLFDTAQFANARAPAAKPAAQAAAPASTNPGEPRPPTSAANIDSPPAPPSAAELQASYHQALGDREHSIENFFIDDDLITTSKVALLRPDDDYDRFVEHLQTFTSAAAEQHVATLQQGLNSRPQILDGSVTLAYLACGSILCTVSLTGRDEAAIDDYLAGALRAPGEPVYVAMRVPVTARGGAALRLIFSVDASVKGASSD